MQKNFLEYAGVSEEKLRSEIYHLTHGTPVYLDLCVDRYYSIIENNEAPEIEKFGTNINNIVERFIRYMDNTQMDIVYLLSCLDEWTDDFLFENAHKILNGVSYTALEKIKGYSFILTEDNIKFTMHQTIRDTLYSDSKNKFIKEKTNVFMESCLYNELEQVLPSSYNAPDDTRHFIQ